MRSCLRTVLASKTFSAAPRLRRFLEFVAEKRLSGEHDEIKEFLVAAEVYGRGADYDPQVDSTVRVEASRLRNKLRAYYDSEGREDTIWIELPKGSYVPKFHRRTEAVAMPTGVPDASILPPAPRIHVPVAGLLSACLVGLFLWNASAGGVAPRPSTSHGSTGGQPGFVQADAPPGR